ncbi:hypothetical protein [Paenibacillus koleovorans]|uniref:hypothetical protein n=1 Tax=Paenibacillus koleovorans TaxID=121608 RepID=UPI0013E31A21|nr:hypothetical protein [Paenibacillus koleovorans]
MCTGSSNICTGIRIGCGARRAPGGADGKLVLDENSLRDVKVQVKFLHAGFYDMEP